MVEQERWVLWARRSDFLFLYTVLFVFAGLLVSGLLFSVFHLEVLSLTEWKFWFAWSPFLFAVLFFFGNIFIGVYCETMSKKYRKARR